jgi:hypothetical protein
LSCPLCKNQSKTSGPSCGRLTTQESIFLCVSNAEFKGGIDGHDHDDRTFVVKRAKPSRSGVVKTQNTITPHIPIGHSHISDRNSSSTPGVFYKYFYNHAHRLRLEKLL